ncbi:MAG: hypothetical protein WC954_05270 [Sphaerochaeta sp.]
MTENTVNVLDLGSENMDNIPDLEPAPDGSEVEIRLISHMTGFTKDDQLPYLSPVFELPDYPNAPDFNKFLWLPCDKLREIKGEKKYNQARRSMADFMEAFGITGPRFDMTEYYGSTAYAIVGIEENDEYGRKNRIKKFVLSA